ncbi:hypothetical protein GOODEAATRI_016331, partial [Goodea atripinnis]
HVVGIVITTILLYNLVYCFEKLFYMELIAPVFILAILPVFIINNIAAFATLLD